jgi:choline dehydrogenase-like flavoprotein
MSGAAANPDVIVVGSGAGGGMAAYALAQEGLDVLMLESGRDYEPTTETPMFQLPGEAPLHGAATPDKEYGFYDATAGGGWEVPGEPYTVAEGSAFRWWRARMLGGRTNHWGRMTLRFGPDDFRGRSLDGLGADWPLNYDELAPWYDKVERLIGVFGAAEGIANSPDSPEGILLPPPRPRAFEKWMGMVMGRRHGIPVVPAHMAILTQPHGDRPQCLYATDCMRGCAIGANFQSTTVLIPPARDTGHLAIRTGAHVFEVPVDASGKATGVRFIDRADGAVHEIKARAVIIAASSCESARILLQSRSSAFPNGLGNEQGQVGCNLMDTPSVSVAAQVPQLEDLPAFHDEGVTLFHVYSPWWLTAEQRTGKLGFARGCHIEFWGGRRLPEFDDMTTIAALAKPGTGAALHAEMRRLYGSIVYLSGRGEMIPNNNSHCELDPDVKDRFGLPVLRFHWQWGAEELAQMDFMRGTLAHVFKDMGANILTDLDRPIAEVMRPGGHVIHEAGTLRMAERAADGPVDRWGRLHTTPNLYIADAGLFPSMPCKNPTLTIMALAWRGAQHLAEGLKRGDA